MKAEHDPLASHIFVSRRYYRNVNDTKSGKRREMMARLSFNTACELGFRGSLDGRISISVIAPAPPLLDHWLMIVRSENDVIMQAEIG